MVRNGYVTFGSLNKLVKASRSCLELWRRVFEAVPRSRLLLATWGGADAEAGVRQTLAAAGLDASRVELVARTRTKRDYYDRFALLDIALDPFPFNGITTTADALWMGVPVVTLAGQTFASRAGVSLLSAVGRTELIAPDADAYLRLAAGLANDPARLFDLHANLQKMTENSSLCDGRRLARVLCEAYRRMREASLSAG